MIKEPVTTTVERPRATFADWLGCLGLVAALIVAGIGVAWVGAELISNGAFDDRCSTYGPGWQVDELAGRELCRHVDTGMTVPIQD